MKALVTPKGEYDHDAINDLVAANFTLRAKLSGQFITLVDIEIATRDAWHRAEAEMTRWNVTHNRNLSEIAEEVARELATDGVLR